MSLRSQGVRQRTVDKYNTSRTLFGSGTGGTTSLPPYRPIPTLAVAVHGKQFIIIIIFVLAQLRVGGSSPSCVQVCLKLDQSRTW
jgi:hypothetical protein